MGPKDEARKEDSADETKESTAATDKATEESTAPDAETVTLDKPEAEEAETKTVKAVKTAKAKKLVPKPAAKKPTEKPSWLLPALGAGAALAALLVVLLIANMFWVLPFLNGKSDRLADEREEARNAACEYANKLGSYTFNDIDGYINGVLDVSTGKFKESFTADSAKFRDGFTQIKAVSKLTKASCAVESSDDGHYKVILVMTLAATSIATDNKEQRQTVPPFVLELEKTDGRWLISSLDSPYLVPDSADAMTPGVPSAPADTPAPAPAPEPPAPAPGG
ncbi:hypothetical protein [Antrihabitans stalactiti]|jgi:Mce-associated membrane protein|uniref:Mce-associated membrane protein n=1 Tax=Antrihabitans stalactiti TaxID=2584121 RepID=A0A848KCV4_9NOCA|nr:hypothetical protein [Antrihabitans stalactiti]NMN95388.1 hypothetical protein [Antrihabitans stalactiti]